MSGGRRRHGPVATVVVVMLAATLAAAAPGPAEGAETDGRCPPLPESVDLVLSFSLDGGYTRDESHSVREWRWAMEVEAEATLFSEWDDGNYGSDDPGSRVRPSGELSHEWTETYKQIDLSGEGGFGGGTADPTSTLALHFDDDDGRCRFRVSYAPRFEQVSWSKHYTDSEPESGIGPESIGSFQVYGDVTDDLTGIVHVSGRIPADGNTFTDGDSEINGPSNLDATVTVELGERTLQPSAALIVEHLDVPSLDEWVEVPNGETFEGNVVRLTARVDNPSEPTTARIAIRDETEDRVVAGPIHVAVETGENTYEWELPTEGRAWADDGSPADEIELNLLVDLYGTTRDDQATLAVRPRPVALVHGWNSDASGWAGYAELLRRREPSWEVHAVGDGRFDGRMETGSIANPLARGLGLPANAAQLATYVEDMRAELDAQRIDIVAHSMGGLISRYYVAALMEVPNGTPAATRMLMLGTPNLGSPCAAIIPHSSAIDLHPELVAQFNALITATYGVEYAILAGDSWPATCQVPGEGDMVVPVESAFGLPYVTDRQRTGTDHVSMTGSRSDAENYVVPRLTRPAAAGSSRGAATVRPVSFAAQSEPASPTHVLAAGILDVGPDGAEVPVVVDALAEIGATIVAAPGVTVALRAPTSAPTTGEPGADEELDAPHAPPAISDGATTSVDQPVASTDPVDEPTPGTWTLRLSSDDGSSTAVAYAVVGHGEPAPSLTVSDDGDSAVAVVTAVGDEVAPVVEARLVGDRGRSSELTVLADKGGRHTISLPSGAAGSVLVVTATTEAWARTVRHPIVPDDAFDVAVRTVPEPVALITPPEAVEPVEPVADDVAAPADNDDGDGGVPVAVIAVLVLVTAAAGVVVVRRRSSR